MVVILRLYLDWHNSFCIRSDPQLPLASHTQVYVGIYSMCSLCLMLLLLYALTGRVYNELKSKLKSIWTYVGPHVVWLINRMGSPGSR